MTTGNTNFALSNHTVIFTDKESIDNIMKETGVSSLEGFCNVANALAKVTGPEHGVEYLEADREKWGLGGATIDLAMHLTSYLKDSSDTEVVQMVA